jgi:hypothetical protein
MWQALIISGKLRSINRRIVVQSSLFINRDPISTVIRDKMAGGVAQVLKYLFSKLETLSSNPVLSKKEKQEKKERKRKFEEHEYFLLILVKFFIKSPHCLFQLSIEHSKSYLNFNNEIKLKVYLNKCVHIY